MYPISQKLTTNGNVTLTLSVVSPKIYNLQRGIIPQKNQQKKLFWPFFMCLDSQIEIVYCGMQCMQLIPFLSNLRIAFKWPKYIKNWPPAEKSSKNRAPPTFKKAYFSPRNLKISQKMWLGTNKTVIDGQFYLHFDQHGQVSPVLTHFLSRNSPKHPFFCSFKTEALDSNFFDFRQMKQALTKLLSSMLCPHAVATPKQEIWSFWNFWLSPADCLTLTVPLKRPQD